MSDDQSQKQKQAPVVVNMPRIKVDDIYANEKEKKRHLNLLEVCDQEKTAAKFKTANGTRLIQQFTVPRIKVAGIRLHADAGFGVKGFKPENLKAVDTSYNLR